MYASANDHLEVTRYVLEQGANRDKAADDGKTAHGLRSGLECEEQQRSVAD